MEKTIKELIAEMDAIEDGPPGVVSNQDIDAQVSQNLPDNVKKQISLKHQYDMQEIIDNIDKEMSANLPQPVKNEIRDSVLKMVMDKINQQN